MSAKHQVSSALVSLEFIRLTTFIITLKKKIFRAVRGKVYVGLWSAGCIRWTKIVCKSCIMATMTFLWRHHLFIYGLGDVATTGGT